MGFEDYKDLLALAASVCTIFQFLTGILECQKFVQKGSTGDVSSFPFIAGFLACSMWLRYGFLIKDTTLILVNTAGSTLYLAYVVTFYLYCLKKSTVLQQLSLTLTLLLATLVYTQYETDTALSQERVGVLCCVVTILFFSSPLSMLAHVIRVKSSETLPFSLIAATFVTSLEWLLYGLVIGDTFVQVPNALGCILSSLQLSLFVIYPALPSGGKVTLR